MGGVFAVAVLGGLFAGRKRILGFLFGEGSVEWRKMRKGP